MRATIAWLVFLLTASCGARTDPALLGTTSAGTTSTGSTSTSSSTSSSSGAGGAACSAMAPIRVTDTESDSQTFVDTVAVDGSTVLIATSAYFLGGPKPDPDPTWRVRSMSADLTSMGPSHIVLTHSSVPSPGYVAAGFGHHGFVAWDAVEGSRFVSLAADGSPAAPPVSLGMDVVSWLIATPGGFVALQSSAIYLGPHTLLVLDASGFVTTSTPLSGLGAHPNAANGTGLMAFDDGTLLVSWIGGTAFAIMAQHLSASGAPMADPAQLFDTSKQTVGNNVSAMTSLGTSALVAWANDAGGFRLVEPIDEDGHAGAQTMLGKGVSEGLGLGAGPGGAFAAWAEVPDGSAVGDLMAQALTAEGMPIGAAFPIAPGLNATAPIVAVTPAGEIVAFVGAAPGEQEQAYVTRLSCGL